MQTVNTLTRCYFLYQGATYELARFVRNANVRGGEVCKGIEIYKHVNGLAGAPYGSGTIYLNSDMAACDPALYCAANAAWVEYIDGDPQITVC